MSRETECLSRNHAPECALVTIILVVAELLGELAKTIFGFKEFVSVVAAVLDAVREVAQVPFSAPLRHLLTSSGFTATVKSYAILYTNAHAEAALTHFLAHYFLVVTVLHIGFIFLSQHRGELVRAERRCVT